MAGKKASARQMAVCYLAGRRMESPPGAAAFTILVDGQPCEAFPGETVAAALYASGRRAWRRARSGGIVPSGRATSGGGAANSVGATSSGGAANSSEMRGLLCGMGVCFDCLVTVDGVPGQRACQVIALPGMTVETDLPAEDR